MSENVLVADAVEHSYAAVPALCGVSFAVRRGTMTGLLGPNGSGKTTLFRLLTTLLTLQTGQLSVCGFDLRSQQKLIRRRIGVTFQSPALDVRLTVLENLHCHAAMYGLAKTETTARIDDLAARFRIGDRLSDVVSTLSGGLKRRAELVKGLLHRPEVLFLDEPCAGLDVRSRREFFEILHEVRHSAATTIVMATHHMDEAEQCDELLLLDHGRIVAGGSAEQLRSGVDGDRIAVRCRDAAALKEPLQTYFGADGVIVGDELLFRVSDPASRLGEVMNRFGEQVISVQLSRPTLEDVFLSRTGHSFRHTEPEP